MRAPPVRLGGAELAQSLASLGVGRVVVGGGARDERDGAVDESECACNPPVGYAQRLELIVDVRETDGSGRERGSERGGRFAVVLLFF